MTAPSPTSSERPGTTASGGSAWLDADLLAPLVRDELAVRPAGPAAEVLAAEIQRRHGDCVVAVLFYGSCLRRQTAEGVLDFYVLVDDYRAAHGSRLAAAANALLPPNVLWLEHEADGEALACKYAVMTVADFVKGAGFEGIDGRVWARFCQPAALLFARDAATRSAIEAAVASAVTTMVRRMLPFMPVEGAVQRFTSGDLFHHGFRETYSAELRSESEETIAGLHARDPERYDRVTGAALAALADAGQIGRVTGDAGGAFEVTVRGNEVRRGRRAWRLRRPLAKGLVVLALLKTAFTQDNWVSYVIWKLERHSGQTIEITDAQRRHPLILGWPVIFRLLRNGVLR